MSREGSRRRLLVVAGLGAALLGPVPSAAGAQRLAPAGVQARSAADAHWSPPGSALTREPSASKYVRRGAVIGAATLGAVALVAAISQDAACLGCSAIIIVPVVLGTGAIVGAAVGYLVYRVRRSRPAA